MVKMHSVIPLEHKNKKKVENHTRFCCRLQLSVNKTISEKNNSKDSIQTGFQLVFFTILGVATVIVSPAPGHVEVGGSHCMVT